MKRSPVVAVLALSLPLGYVDPAAAAVACRGGRFLVGGLPVDAPAIIVEEGRVSLEPTCPPVVGEVKQSKRGTRVRVAWASCQALTGPAGLKATIAGTDCATMTGIFKGRIALCFDLRCDVQRFRQPFIASRAE